MIRDRYGVTAFQMAKTRGYTGIMRLFASQKLIVQVILTRWCRQYITIAFQHPKVTAPVRKSPGNAGKAGDKVGPLLSARM